MARSLVLKLMPLVLAGGLALTACSGSGLTGGIINGAPVVQGSDSGADTGVGLPTDGTDPGFGDTDSDTTEAQQKFVPIDMQVRVVNLWSPAGSGKGGDIDVWSANPRYGGKKLITVKYGTASKFFAPQVQDSPGQGSDPNAEKVDYQLQYYAAGKTDQGNDLMETTPTSSPKLKQTIVLTPNDPQNPNNGATMQTFTDDYGTAGRADNGFPDLLPKPKAGTAEFMINATATEYFKTSDDSSNPAFFAASGGKCNDNYFDNDTGKLHTDPNIGQLVGGTGSTTYVLKPNTTVDLVKQPGGSIEVSQDEVCAMKPSISGIDPKLGDGDRAYGFVYGSDVKSLKILILPLG